MDSEAANRSHFSSSRPHAHSRSNSSLTPPGRHHCTLSVEFGAIRSLSDLADCRATAHSTPRVPFLLERSRTRSQIRADAKLTHATMQKGRIESQHMRTVVFSTPTTIDPACSRAQSWKRRRVEHLASLSRRASQAPDTATCADNMQKLRSQRAVPKPAESC